MGHWHRFVRSEAQLDTADTSFSDIWCLLQDFVELLELLEERLRFRQLHISVSESAGTAKARWRREVGVHEVKTREQFLRSSIESLQSSMMVDLLCHSPSQTVSHLHH